MGVFDVVFVHFAVVALFLEWEDVGGVPLLQKRVAYVPLVFEDIVDGGVLPSVFLVPCGDPHPGQVGGDLILAPAIEIAVENVPDDFSFLLVDLEDSIDQAVSERRLAGDEPSFFHAVLIAPPHVGGYGHRFLLGVSGEKSEEHLVADFSGIEMLLFKVDGHADGFQFPDDLQAFPGISGKAGDGFGQDAVDFPLAAVADHSQKIVPLVHPQSCDALVSVDIDEFPFLVSLDQLGVIAHLCREGV